MRSVDNAAGAPDFVAPPAALGAAPPWPVVWGLESTRIHPMAL